MIPDTQFLKKVCAITRRKYFPPKAEGGRDVRSFFVMVEKSMVSMAIPGVSLTNLPIWPREWVEKCLEWASEKNHTGSYISIVALMNLMKNEDKKVEFCGRWLSAHKESGVKNGFTDKSVRFDPGVEGSEEVYRFS
jgi:hypothetical protein